MGKQEESDHGLLLDASSSLVVDAAPLPLREQFSLSHVENGRGAIDEGMKPKVTKRTTKEEEREPKSHDVY